MGNPARPPTARRSGVRLTGSRVRFRDWCRTPTTAAGSRRHRFARRRERAAPGRRCAARCPRDWSRRCRPAFAAAGRRALGHERRSAASGDTRRHRGEQPAPRSPRDDCPPSAVSSVALPTGSRRGRRPPPRHCRPVDGFPARRRHRRARPSPTPLDLRRPRRPIGLPTRPTRPSALSPPSPRSRDPSASPQGSSSFSSTPDLGTPLYPYAARGIGIRMPRSWFCRPRRRHR